MSRSGIRYSNIEPLQESSTRPPCSAARGRASRNQWLSRDVALGDATTGSPGAPPRPADRSARDRAARSRRCSRSRTARAARRTGSESSCRRPAPRRVPRARAARARVRPQRRHCARCAARCASSTRSQAARSSAGRTSSRGPPPALGERRHLRPGRHDAERALRFAQAVDQLARGPVQLGVPEQRGESLHGALAAGQLGELGSHWSRPLSACSSQ